jgi:hypothetical protein
MRGHSWGQDAGDLGQDGRRPGHWVAGELEPGPVVWGGGVGPLWDLC